MSRSLLSLTFALLVCVGISFFGENFLAANFAYYYDILISIGVNIILATSLNLVAPSRRAKAGTEDESKVSQVGRCVCDTFSARNADSTRLFLMPITRAFHGLPSSGREPHTTILSREKAAVQCGKIGC